MDSLSLLLSLVEERNIRETIPFVELHASNEQLWQELDAVQSKCKVLERQLVHEREQRDHGASDQNHGNDSLASTPTSQTKQSVLSTSYQSQAPTISRSESAALRNERHMLEKLERLQEQIDQVHRQRQQDEQTIQELTKEREDFRLLQKAQEETLFKLQQEYETTHMSLEHLKTHLSDSQQRASLAEQQSEGLKDAIRILQQENKTLQQQQQQQAEQIKQRPMENKNTTSWFGFSSTTASSSPSRTTAKLLQQQQPSTRLEIAKSRQDHDEEAEQNEETSTLWRKRLLPVVQNVIPSIIPSKPQHIIPSAHYQQASCIRHSSLRGSSEILVTGGSVDGTVKVWNTKMLSSSSSSSSSNVVQPQTTFTTGAGNAIWTVDISSNLVAGAGSDKTCRIWSLEDDKQHFRMVHHLVGHAQKITSIRFLGDAMSQNGIVTAGVDRQLKVWDISRQTYRDLSTTHLPSTANSMDVSGTSCAADSSMILGSGHADGGLRFWDLRSSQRTAEFKHLHESAITSVQFHPVNDSMVLTNGMDSCLRITDLRTGKTTLELQHPDFHTSYHWASSCFSPDGVYVGSGSSSNGTIFIWNATTGKLVQKLEGGHSTGVCGISWGRGDSSSYPQVASVDKTGTLILWSS